MHYGPEKADLVLTHPDKKESHPLLRTACHVIEAVADLAPGIARQYSRMKYGDRDAVREIAKGIVQQLINNAAFREKIEEFGSLLLASSAYGYIPTAANAITREMSQLFEAEGLKVETIKIDRRGGFDLTDYGKLDLQQREAAMRGRHISLSAANQDRIKGKFLLVVDDLRSTGAHERAITAYLDDHAAPGALTYAYWIAFRSNLQNDNPHLEERINHSDICDLDDLLALYQQAQAPYLNARVLKFILMEAGKSTEKGIHFFETIAENPCLKLYEAALSKDGYFHRDKFSQGFALLENLCMDKGWISCKLSLGVRNEQEGKLVGWNFSYSEKKGFQSAETGESLESLVERYSRFKFGDVTEVQFFGRELARTIVRNLESHGPLRKVFEAAKRENSHVYLVAPGIRNVVSASNFLLRETGARVNIWLSQHGFPTMILKHLSRLGSGRANYASLNTEDRESRHKTTKTIVPESDYRSFPIHVLFLDDVEITGSTVNRARKQSLEAGARSFYSIFALRAEPSLAQNTAPIEHKMNQLAVSGSLDQTIIDILSQPDYQPVQRMLRLILHPDNRADLPKFSRLHIPDHSLSRLYIAAMGNDYLWIQPSQTADKRGFYGPSLDLLKTEMISRGLADENGLLN